MATRDLWRLCADWLIRCEILPRDHRVMFPNAEIFDLAQTLRDGVLLCHLLNTLSPGAVDMKDFSQRPQMSQFLCLKNIRTFLQTCKNKFGLRESDLFDSYDLFDVKDFAKVLNTLSKLSKSELALASGIDGFPQDNSSIQVEHDYYNTLEELATGFPPDRLSRVPSPVEDVYRTLEDRACELPDEDIYSAVTTVEEGEQEIYEDLCSLRGRTTRRRKERERDQLEQGFEPKTKREHCLKELIETEKNYVEALQMIKTFFIHPLKNIIPSPNHELIFKHIEGLGNIHTAFQSDLHQAVRRSSAQALGDCFIKYKPQLLLYGDFCSNLPQAQERIDDLCRKNEIIRVAVEECQRKANEGKFRLRDLLSVPVQRVLKYHLLLKELIKQTDKKSPDRTFLEKALEAMQDLSLYVNEVKRDNEQLQLIQEIQDSIVDLQMPEKTSLKDYGRLLKDGELKIKSHEDNRLKTRYIFLFDKVMLMCKSRTMEKFLWGETYSYKNALVLAQHRVEEGVPAGRPRSEKWGHVFLLSENKNSVAYNFYAKTEEMKMKWVDAIKMALDNTNPANAREKGHDFIMTTFEEPQTCSECKKLLRGVFYQGYNCHRCKQSVHKECIQKASKRECHISNGPAPELPPRPIDRSSTVYNHRSASVSSAHSRGLPAKPSLGIKVKAVASYTGTPAPPTNKGQALKFEQGDVIDLISNDNVQWWEGRLHGKEGFFLKSYVEEYRRPSVPIPVPPPPRKPSYEQQVLPSLSQAATHYRGRGSGGHQYVNAPSLQEEFKQYPWYVGEMSRESAMVKLEHHPSSTYLIRESINPARRGDYALSVKYDNNVKHIRVMRTQEGSFYLADCRFFRSIPELVDYYQKNSLAYSFPELDTVLSIPYNESVRQNAVFHPAPRETPALGYAVASFDYAATATNQISLTKGDRIKIVSKQGEDRGWWKGELRGKIGYFPCAYVDEEEDAADGNSASSPR
ncbi:proto-oncogene vav isoform X2 [Lingula anatina]|uniref:Proto-oncogene vav isoform X2 n=1 Tax=Lingula anatina TaxID=7574 RepID=A0A1S3JNI9_LINAN|nr:proto-oncogene vav isoform X2 [Lingula anatina]|eukprot:XP_013411701.1 proto-oncogene vav isoform X2 [Lingula anatina]